jgi:hypothetical protein
MGDARVERTARPEDAADFRDGLWHLVDVLRLSEVKATLGR